MKRDLISCAFLLALTLSSSAQGTWTTKTSLTGAARWGAVGFSIGAKGYVGTGLDAASARKDWFEFDPGAMTSVTDQNKIITVWIYPNPVQLKADIFVKNLDSYADFILYDLSGKEVYSKTFRLFFTFYNPGLPAGTYLYAIRAGKTIVPGKLVIE